MTSRLSDTHCLGGKGFCQECGEETGNGVGRRVIHSVPTKQALKKKEKVYLPLESLICPTFTDALVYLLPCSPLPWRYDLQVFLKRVNVALRSGSVTLTLFFFICVLFLVVAIHFLSWISLESVSQGP